MLLTPPDVFSQTLLAIPMYCLFEVGIFFSRFYVGKGRRGEEEDPEEAPEAETITISRSHNIRPPIRAVVVWKGTI